MESESSILKKIMLSIGDVGCVIFRNTVGLLYTKSGTPTRVGLEVGSSDLIGWKTITITEDMLGDKVAVFTAIEVKNLKGKASKAQLNFIRCVNEAGGIAGIARSPEEARKILSGS